MCQPEIALNRSRRGEHMPGRKKHCYSTQRSNKKWRKWSQSSATGSDSLSNNIFFFSNLQSRLIIRFNIKHTTLQRGFIPKWHQYRYRMFLKNNNNRGVFWFSVAVRRMWIPSKSLVQVRKMLLSQGKFSRWDESPGLQCQTQDPLQLQPSAPTSPWGFVPVITAWCRLCLCF